MPRAPIDVDPDVYLSAGDLFLQVDDAVCDLVASAATTAGGGGGMAGTDSGGVDWASAYDEAAADALETGATLTATLGHLGELLGTTAANHAGADASSTPGGPASYPGDGGGPGAVTVVPATPPSADGTDDHPPHGWFLIAHLLEYTWPNGHQDRLRTVAGGWTDAATGLDTAADRLTRAVTDVSALQSPEVDAAVAPCRQVQQSVRDLSESFTCLGTACSDYASHLDDAHFDVIAELTEYLAESAGLQVLSAVAAPFTAGGSELAGQAAQAARTALTASRVGRILEKLVSLVRTITTTVRTVLTRIREVLSSLKAVLAKGGARAVEEVTHLPQFSQLRRVAVSLAQAERKFKHAAAFGVTLPRGRAGFEAFARAIQSFVRSPSTIRVTRVYRGQPAILNYDPATGLAVVQKPTGEFVTGWKMSNDQLEAVLSGRPLSGS